MDNSRAQGTTQVAQELRDIQLELIDLLDRAKELLRNAPSITRERAQSYWLAHARMAITKNHDYLGGSMFDMDDSIKELEDAAQEVEES